MRKVTLFIAMSLDGYIADEKGGVDWLAGQDPAAGDGDSYSRFVEGIDTVIMGWNTYHQVVTELSPDAWAYEGLESYVLTHKALPSQRGITFTDEGSEGLLRRLQARPGKGIWICGGAQVVRQLMEADLIDEYVISVIPVLLGGGVRLFEGGFSPRPLRLVGSRSENGIMELTYEKR